MSSRATGAGGEHQQLSAPSSSRGSGAPMPMTIPAPKAKLSKAERRQLQEKHLAEKAAKRAEKGLAPPPPPTMKKKIPTPSSNGPTGTTSNSLLSSSNVDNNNNTALGNNPNAVNTPATITTTTTTTTSTTTTTATIAAADQSILSSQSSMADLHNAPSTTSNINNQQQPQRSNTLPPGTPTIRTPAQMRFDDPKMRQKIQKETQRTVAQKPVALFSHLTQYEKKSNYTTTSANTTGENIHPAIVNLGLQYAEFSIAGGNARCVAMLTAFKKVIMDYVTPSGISLQRHLTTFLSKQIDFLRSSRVLAASMKNAIRWLKSEIALLSIDMPDADAKATLCEEINMYIKSKIILADEAIVTHTLRYIYDGDVILTFSRSSIVLSCLLAAHWRGVRFRVIVCDARPKLEGKEMLESLVSAGIKCTYIFTPAIPAIIKEVTKALIGASALNSNGAVMSRTGTAVVAMLAHDHQIPVIVCCETYKFSDQVLLDSFVWNEIGDPDELLDISNQCPSRRLPSIMTTTTPTTTPNTHHLHHQRHSAALKDWREVDALRLLNLHYDITPAHFLTVICCDIGVIAPTSVVTVMRDIESRQQQQQR